VPCITTDDPWESYYYGRNPPKEGFTWTYHFFWGLDQVLACFIGLWKEQQTNKVVGSGLTFLRNRHPTPAFCWSMIFSENRLPLFRIMLRQPTPVRPGKLGRSAAD
jgi:hypothetical protein